MHGGKWESVLRQTNDMSLPDEMAWLLLEQVTVEMVEQKNYDTALMLLRQTPALAVMRSEDPTRYMKLERLVSHSRTRLDGFCSSLSTNASS